MHDRIFHAIARLMPAVVALCFASWASAFAEKVTYDVGVARIDITPDGPIHLSGSAAHAGESDGVDQKLWAKALAISTTDDDVVVLITVDATTIPKTLINELAGRLRSDGIARERLAVCVTNTHSAPLLGGRTVNEDLKDLPADQQEHIKQYRQLLGDKLADVARDAMLHRKSAKLDWGEGKATFAESRGTPGGPADSAVPLLRITDAKDGRVLAVLVNYPCCGTAIRSDTHRISGDWAGYAAEELERDTPGMTAMVAVGCGADMDPKPGGGIDIARAQGRTISNEVHRLLTTELRPLTAPITPRLERIQIHFDKLPSKAGRIEPASPSGAVKDSARKDLARPDRDESVPADLPYTIQTWTFGDQLAMVLLSGEVVGEYSVRLKKEFDPARLWINAFSNDLTCRILSRRILADGGRGAGGGMRDGDPPARLAAGVENDIVRKLHELLPDKLRTDEQRAQFPRPKPASEAIDRFRLRGDLKIELVASEPLVQSPVAIDWGNDGKLWVAEMIDYPTGLHESGTPGGCIKFLEDTNGDGKYDKGTVFLDGLSFPTGIMAWRKGVIICTASQVIYAEDTDGDGRADIRKVLLTGFSSENEQWLVNTPTWGLDNWVYCASGSRADSIQIGTSSKRVSLGSRDFRFNPDTLAFEPVSGHSQQGRVRDDWGRWFGNDNSNLIFHFPMSDEYFRRNPNVAPATSAVSLSTGHDPYRLFPASRSLLRPDAGEGASRVTSACGLAIYRDTLLGDEFIGNSFTCEPAHNLVRRMILKPAGLTFTAEQAPDEQDREFLSSTDNWFRPVQARTGPDGALWVVDMYRFVIDHPRSIATARLAELDVRAGADRGRIYRIFPKSSRPAPIVAFAKQSTAAVAKLIDSTNGTLRDAVHRELCHRKDAVAVPVLRDIAMTSDIPAARAQALCALDGFDGLAPDLIEAALRDPRPEVRAVAVRLSEPWLALSPSLTESLEPLVNDPDIGVRYQLALSLGSSQKPEASSALALIAAKDLNDPWIREAVVSGSVGRAIDILMGLRGEDEGAVGRGELLRGLITTASATREGRSPNRLLLALLPSLDVEINANHFRILAQLLDAWPDDILGKPIAINPGAASRVERIIDAARNAINDREADPDFRSSAAALLGREPKWRADDLKALAALLRPKIDDTVQASAVMALARSGDDRAATALITAWPESSNSLREKILDALLGRPLWSTRLADAVKNKAIPLNEIDATRRARPAEIIDGTKTPDALAKTSSTEDHTKIVEHLSAATKLKGDASSGGAVFNRLCASCHALNGEGHAVGPDLRAISDKSADSLLKSIFDPNASIEGKYFSYSLLTAAGRTITGIISDETATSLKVIERDGVEITTLRKDLKSIQPLKSSMMPEGLEAGLSAQEVANIMRYVQEAR